MAADPFQIRSDRVPPFDAHALALVRRPLWVTDPLHGRMLHANAAGVALWGAPDLATFLARDVSGVSPAVRTRTAAQMPALAAGEAVAERCTLYPQGRATTCDLLVSGLRLADDRVVMLIEATPLAIPPAEVRALEALRHTGVLVTLYDGGGQALFRNPAAQAAYPEEPHRWGAQFGGAADAAALWAEARLTGRASRTLRARTAAGERWHGVSLSRAVDPATGAAGVLVDERDVTGEVEAQARIAHAAYHDGLTGALNRAGFSMALADAEAGGGFALFLLDLDCFKPVNDLHGHAAGDAVLAAVATRLRAAAGEGASVARLGGDEFAVLAPGRWTGPRADALAARLIAAVREPVEHEGRSLSVGVSLGHALAESGVAGAVAMRRADEAMYAAKRGGRGVRWRPSGRGSAAAPRSATG